MRQIQATETRMAILRAAQHVFSRSGYATVGIRDIASSANVNSALISRYFGSKLELYEAALEAALDVSLFTELDRSEFGTTLTESFCGAGVEDAPSIAMLAFAASDPETRECALALLNRIVIEPLENWFGEPEATQRAAQLMIIVTGFFLYRVMLPLAATRGDTTPEMRRWLAIALQEIVDRS